MTAARLAVAAAAAVAFAVPPAPAADQAAVTAAIQKGTGYLRGVYAAQVPGGGAHGIGPVALAGLALLEGKVPKDDPAVQTIAAYLRKEGLVENKTYQAALCLVFLDKLGDPRDVPLLQVLGVRLYAGMNVSAGWTYTTCPEVPPAEASRLASALAQPVSGGTLHPEAARQLKAVRASIAAVGRGGGAASGDDNSNTQFGLVGIWVASRHGLPVADALKALEARFLRSQNQASGGWGYTLATAEGTPAMTCAGLLALAAGASVRDLPKSVTVGTPDRPPPPPAAKGKLADPFSNPRGVTKGPIDPGKPEPPKPAEPEPEPEAVPSSPAPRNAAVRAALMALGRFLGGTPPPAGPVPTGGGPLAAFVGAGNYFYLLWSVERVGVAYGLETIGEVNWYDWGCGYLLPAQAADGSWGNSDNYGPSVNTPFAVLFLCKANLIGDLTRNLKGRHKDPGRSELRGGGPPPLAAPARPEPPPPAIPDVPVEDAAALPEVKDPGEAVRRSQRLTAATDEEWPDRLVELRDSKGPMNTLALARAIALLDGVRRVQARDTLADRLVRMTPATLRGLLRDPDPEIRRAAVLACAMKGDAAHVPDLIDRLTDPADAVGRAARAGLRSLAGKDFGPEAGAPDDAKRKAVEDWRAWAAARRADGR